MSIVVTCQVCQARYGVEDRFAGKTTRCKCGATLNIPALEEPLAELDDPLPDSSYSDPLDAPARPPKRGKKKGKSSEEVASNQFIMRLVGGALAICVTIIFALWVTMSRQDARLTDMEKLALAKQQAAQPVQIAPSPPPVAVGQPAVRPTSVPVQIPPPTVSIYPSTSVPAQPPSVTPPNHAPPTVSQPPTTNPPRPSGASQQVTGFEGWLQDFDEAQRQAASQKKDVLVLFNGSDWCGYSVKLGKEIFFRPEFRAEIDRRFVLVIVDFPRYDAAKAKVQNPERNRKLLGRFGVRGYPHVMFTDARGMPYAFNGYQPGGVPNYMKQLEEAQQARQRRDQLLAKVEQSQGKAKWDAAEQVLEFLREEGLFPHYGPLFAEWSQLAQKDDPRNGQGVAEVFFELTWMVQFMQVAQSESADQINLIVEQLAEWRKTNKFKDPDRGARMHVLASRLLALTGQTEKAKEYLADASRFPVTDPETKARLGRAERSFSSGVGSGTGFVIGAAGYIMTNHHVVAGNGKIQVRIPGRTPTTVSGRVVCQDEKLDIAVVKIDVPAGVSLRPMPLAGERAMNRGERVAAFGYPLGDSFGSGLKLTTGVVSAVPEETTQNMLLIECTVNPGNSGGPLCDAFGNVVGMVTAKSMADEGIDSYGMARPAPELVAFLVKNRIPVERSRPSTGGAAAQGVIDNAPAPVRSTALNGLLLRLKSKTTKGRVDAVTAIGKLGTAAERVVPELTKLSIEDTSEEVRAAAAEALTAIADEVHKASERGREAAPNPAPAGQAVSGQKALEWHEVDKLVSPSVLMIIKTL